MEKTLAATIPDKSLGTLAHFCSICHGNLSFRLPPPPPPPQFNVVYRDEVVIARFQHRHCSFTALSGGRGFLIPLMPLVIVCKIACQRMFQLSDPGVPRTFVEDCSYLHKAANQITGVPNSRFEESIKYLWFIYAYRVRRDCFMCAVLCYTLDRWALDLQGIVWNLK